MIDFTFKDFEKAIAPISEEKAIEFLDIIYPERRGIGADVSPKAGSYKKRLLFNVKHYWKRIDLEKLENIFNKINLSIYHQK